MTTLKLLTERIRRILAGGNPSTNDRVKDAEIQYAIVAACGRALKLETLNTQFNIDGGSIPNGRMIATYVNQPVKRGDGNYSRVDLPITPIDMPEWLSVFALYPSGKPMNAFMFIPPGIINMWAGVRALNPINAVMFTAESRYLDIYADLLGAGIPTVDMKLCVVDIALMGDYDPLPISPDMEKDVIAEVLQQYGIEPRTERKEGREASPEKGA